MSVTVKEISNMKNPTGAIEDGGNVRLGVTTPLFPPVRSGTPATSTDSGRVRMGTVSPTFPPVRTS